MNFCKTLFIHKYCLFWACLRILVLSLILEPAHMICLRDPISFSWFVLFSLLVFDEDAFNI